MAAQRCFKLSASSIQAFKACPRRFQFGYREGLRKDRDTDAQRMGTNWHAVHEVYVNALQAWDSGPHERPDGLGAYKDASCYAQAQVVDHLNDRYLDLPSYKTQEEWALEQKILLVSFVGYQWYWQNDLFKTLASELMFDLPLIDPRVGLPLPLSEVVRTGKIDHIILWQKVIGNVERKSTSRAIAPESDYWDRSTKDTQVSMYALACRDMLRAGTLPKAIIRHLAFNLGSFGNTIYDVWHKPTIKPKTLTQKDTKAFLKTHTYCDGPFKVEISPGVGGTDIVTVNEEVAEVILGKKANAIKETVDMFGTRLLLDITTRPEFYFQRREIARTDRDLERFEKELFNIYQAQKMMDRSNCWYENESQCRATFHCQYIPICYGPGADAVCDGKTTPDGFRRIFNETEALNTPTTEEE